MNDMAASTKAMAQAFEIEQGWAVQLAEKHNGFGRLPKSDDDLLYDFTKDPGRAIERVKQKYGAKEAKQYVDYIQKLRGQAGPAPAPQAPAQPAPTSPTPTGGGY